MQTAPGDQRRESVNGISWARARSSRETAPPGPERLGRLRPALILAVAIICTGCFGAEAQLAGRSVDEFHAQVDAGQFDQIYARASAEFQRATTQEDWTALLTAVQRKLGKVQTSRQATISVSGGSFGTAVNMTYETKFTEGPATENFSWAIRGGAAVLVGYRINSLLLITR